MIWTTLTNNVESAPYFLAGPNDLWSHTDLNSTHHGERHYRSAVPGPE